MPSNKEPFTLFLAPWQTRMARDFLPRGIAKVVKVRINPGVIRCPASYKISPEGLSKRDWILYLTDEQMVIVKERFNLKTAISGINVTQALLESQSVVFM